MPQPAVDDLKLMKEKEFLDRYFSENESSVFVGILVGINILIITSKANPKKHKKDVPSFSQKRPIELTLKMSLR